MDKEIKQLITIDSLVVNLEKRQASVAGVAIHLTRTEYQILALLAKNRQKIFSLEEIYHNVWGENGVAVGDNAIMSHIKHLRQKIDHGHKQLIKTVWGKGYYIE